MIFFIAIITHFILSDFCIKHFEKEYVCRLNEGEIHKFNKINKSIPFISSFLTLFVYFNACCGSYLMLIFLLIVPILIYHFVIDIRFKELPDEFNLIIFLIVFLGLLIFNEISINRLSSMAILGAFYFIVCMTGNMGGGDLKLALATSMLFTKENVFEMLYLPILLGSIYASIMLLSKKYDKKTTFAFGPFIIISIIYIFVKHNF